MSDHLKFPSPFQARKMLCKTCKFKRFHQLSILHSSLRGSFRTGAIIGIAGSEENT